MSPNFSLMLSESFRSSYLLIIVFISAISCRNGVILEETKIILQSPKPKFC